MLYDAKNVLRHLTLISFLYVPIRFYHIPKFCPFTHPLKALLDIFGHGANNPTPSLPLFLILIPSHSPPLLRLTSFPEDATFLPRIVQLTDLQTNGPTN